jgi:hypothetical protein
VSEALDNIATGDGWWGKWRVVQAWELTIEIPIVVAATVYRIAMADQFVVDALVKLEPLINIYLIARFSVLGIHLWQGSRERQLSMELNSDGGDPTYTPSYPSSNNLNSRAD